MEKTAKKKLRPYDQRTDLEKIQAQWTKLSGLLNRTDWSAAVVRAATATEIAVNLAIRQEFADRSQLEAAFIDSLLAWANGLKGKMENLLLPLLKGRDRHTTVSDLYTLARRIHKKRNNIAHRGEFADEQEARDLVRDCQTFVHGVVQLY